jgi:solute:Na+ symporter, SSS family
LIIGVLFGALTTSITEVMMWIVGGLYGGYVMANVLKWYWWRFNGYGYFWGMMAGLLSAMFVPSLAALLQIHVANTLYLFPVILGCSIAGCLLGTFLTKPEDDAVLKNFYQTVNPWGFWRPIREKVMKENPSFRPNPDFGKDCANVTVGIVWQLCLTALPIYLVLREWSWVAGIAALLAVTSIFLKFNWYDKLEKA